MLLPASDKVVRAAVRSLPTEHAAALFAVAVFHVHQRPSGNAKLCVAARELLLAHGASFGDIEGSLHNIYCACLPHHAQNAEH